MIPLTYCDQICNVWFGVVIFLCISTPKRGVGRPVRTVYFCLHGLILPPHPTTTTTTTPRWFFHRPTKNQISLDPTLLSRSPPLPLYKPYAPSFSSAAAPPHRLPPLPDSSSVPWLRAPNCGTARTAARAWRRNPRAGRGGVAANEQRRKGVAPDSWDDGAEAIA